MNQDINVLALVKGAERYVFLYDDSSRAETLRVLGRYASNPELSFTWYDAAVLSQKIRQESRKAPAQMPGKNSAMPTLRNATMRVPAMPTRTPCRSRAAKRQRRCRGAVCAS